MKYKKTTQLNEQELFVPPSTEEMIKQDLLSVFEFSCMLTEWPKSGIFRSDISLRELIDPNIPEEKPYFIFPEKPFYLKKFSKNFQKIYLAIHEDINNELLKYRHCFFYTGHNYLISRFELIFWAIKNKFLLPLDLQKALSIRIKQHKRLQSWRNKVEIMIIKQYSTLLENETSPSKIIGSQLMQTYVPKSKNINQYRQLKRDISRVSKKRNPGWQKITNDAIQNCNEPPIIIPEILVHNGNYSECDFVLLREIIIAAVFVKSKDIIGIEKVRKMSLAEFMLLMIRDEVINLYLKESPTFILQFIETTIKEIYDFLPKLFPLASEE